jgi:Eukaryotic initiation factor 4E
LIEYLVILHIYYATCYSVDDHDPANDGGGRFVFSAKDDASFDGIWLRVVEFIMKAQFAGAYNINGALVKTTGRKIAICTGNAQNDLAVELEIRKDFEEDFKHGPPFE